MAKPIKKLWDFPFQVSFFENVNKDGGVFLSTSITRTYKDKNGAWQNESLNVSPAYLLKFAAILKESYQFALDWERQRRQKQKEERQEGAEAGETINPTTAPRPFPTAEEYIKAKNGNDHIPF